MFKVQKKQCSTCIYRPNNPLELEKLEDAIRLPDGQFSGHRICHHAGNEDICCNGFWVRHKNNFNFGRIAQRLGCVEYVEVDKLSGVSDER